MPAKARLRSQPGGLAKKSADLVLRIDMGLASPVRSSEKTGRGNLRPWVEGSAVLGEDADHLEPACEVETVGSRRQRYPSQRQVAGDRPMVAARVSVAPERQQHLALSPQLEAEASPRSQVPVNAALHAGGRGHDACPGHGCAISARWTRSTFAYTVVVSRSRCRRTSAISFSVTPA